MNNFLSIETFTSKEDMDRSIHWFFGIVMTLVMFGLVMVYSAKTVRATRVEERNARQAAGAVDPLYDMDQVMSGARSEEGSLKPLHDHAIKAAIGLFLMLVMLRLDYRDLGRHYLKIWIFIVVALGLVLIPGIGVQVNGARRWYSMMGFMIQPSEFAKLGLIIVMSCVVMKAGENIQSFARGFLPSFFIFALVCFLILLGPDLGTTVITGCLCVTLLVIGGVRTHYYAGLLMILVPLLFLFAYNEMGHVAPRITKFIDPPKGEQLHFSLMAFASGGLLGSGLGGSLCKLNFLPECESDFIFSIIGEELGFIGTTLVLCLYAALIFHGIRIIRGIKNRLGFYMATGVVILISTQALVNVAVVVGVAPTKGLPLPFISSGGSSLIALMMAVGLLLNIARNPERASGKIRDDLCEKWFHQIVLPIQSTVNAGGRDDL